MSATATPPPADSPTGAESSGSAPRRALPLWAALALSLATVGPTLAMSGNGQGLVAIVGKSVPLVFVIGAIGVALVGYGFMRLTRHLNHAGSAYGLIGGTIGPRTGFFSGWAMLGAYVGFSIGTLALTAAFVNALIAGLQPGAAHPFQLPWPLIMIVGAAVSFLLAGRDVALIAKVLLVIEGVGIVAMIVLVIAIFGHGGAPAHRHRPLHLQLQRDRRRTGALRRGRRVPVLGRLRGVRLARRGDQQPASATSRGPCSAP